MMRRAEIDDVAESRPGTAASPDGPRGRTSRLLLRLNHKLRPLSRAPPWHHRGHAPAPVPLHRGERGLAARHGAPAVAARRSPSRRGCPMTGTGSGGPPLVRPLNSMSGLAALAAG